MLMRVYMYPFITVCALINAGNNIHIYRRGLKCIRACMLPHEHNLGLCVYRHARETRHPLVYVHYRYTYMIVCIHAGVLLYSVAYVHLRMYICMCLAILKRLRMYTCICLHTYMRKCLILLGLFTRGLNCLNY